MVGYAYSLNISTSLAIISDSQTMCVVIGKQICVKFMFILHSVKKVFFCRTNNKKEEFINIII